MLSVVVMRQLTCHIILFVSEYLFASHFLMSPALKLVLMLPEERKDSASKKVLSAASTSHCAELSHADLLSAWEMTASNFSFGMDSTGEFSGAHAIFAYMNLGVEFSYYLSVRIHAVCVVSLFYFFAAIWCQRIQRISCNSCAQS